MTTESSEVRCADLLEYVERCVAPVAQSKGLPFQVTVDEALPPSVRTDGKRLQQILRNRLSNAFKFTEQGSVSMHVQPAVSGWGYGKERLDRADAVVAFAVTDTGIGIPDEKQRLIFEAFQQADGSTSRKYGGTGLGLSISRELAALLGGAITVRSAPGQGSTFTFYLPVPAPHGELPAPQAPAPALLGQGSLL